MGKKPRRWFDPLSPISPTNLSRPSPRAMKRCCHLEQTDPPSPLPGRSSGLHPFPPGNRTQPPPPFDPFIYSGGGPSVRLKRPASGPARPLPGETEPESIYCSSWRRTEQEDASFRITLILRFRERGEIQSFAFPAGPLSGIIRWPHEHPTPDPLLLLLRLHERVT